MPMTFALAWTRAAEGFPVTPQGTCDNSICNTSTKPACRGQVLRGSIASKAFLPLISSESDSPMFFGQDIYDNLPFYQVAVAIINHGEEWVQSQVGFRYLESKLINIELKATSLLHKESYHLGRLCRIFQDLAGLSVKPSTNLGWQRSQDWLPMETDIEMWSQCTNERHMHCNCELASYPLPGLPPQISLSHGAVICFWILQLRYW